MPPRPRALALVALAGLCLALALVAGPRLAALLAGGSAPPPAPAAPTAGEGAGGPGATASGGGDPAAGPGAAAAATILARPLFEADRRPPEPPQEAPPPPPPPEEEPEDPRPQHRLAGIVRAGGQAYAVLVDEGGKTLAVAEGAAIGDGEWTLGRIDGRGARLDGPDGFTVDLELPAFGEGSGGGAGLAAAPPPPPQPQGARPGAHPGGGTPRGQAARGAPIDDEDEVDFDEEGEPRRRGAARPGTPRRVARPPDYPADLRPGGARVGAAARPRRTGADGTP